MNTKLRTYRIIYYVLLCATILVYILIREVLSVLFVPLTSIFFILLPVLIAETEVYACLEHFVFGLRPGKIKTSLIGIRFLFGAGFLLFGLIGLVTLLLEQPQANEIPFDFGAATILLGLSKLIYSVWEIVRYKRNVSERNVIKILLLVGKLIFSLLVIYMGWWGMLIGSLILAPL